MALLALAVSVCACTAFGAASSTARAATVAEYRIEGGGWGHGIGMSQYGAQGYAGRKWGYQRILRHYYSGSVVAPRPATSRKNLRVLLQSRLKLARITTLSTGSVRQGTSRLALATGDVVELTEKAGSIQVARIRGKGRVALAASSALPIVDSAVDGALRIEFDADYARKGARFRGVLTATSFDGGVAVVNLVPMESYLRGVVPDEMPPSWRAHALRAQAVAARSYAETHLGGTGYPWFDLWSDTRSQVYGGVGAEEPSTDAAIVATAGEVVRVGTASGDVADTFFFSTSPGRTAANEEVWGSAPRTYLRSVVSPFEQESPYAVWKGDDIQRFTRPVLASRLAGRFTGTLRGIFVATHPSGFAKSVTIRGSEGSTTITPSKFQSLFELRSTFVRVALLQLTAPAAAPEGARVRLTGLAPIRGTTRLGVRHAGEIGYTWVVLRPAAGGAWTATTRITGDTSVQLRRMSIVGPARSITATPPAPPV